MADIPLKDVFIKVGDLIDQFGLGGFDFDGTKAINLADPTNPQDGATQSWTLTEIGKIDNKGFKYSDFRYIELTGFPIPLLTDFAALPASGGKGVAFEITTNGVLSIRNDNASSVLVDYRYLVSNIGGYPRTPNNSAASIVSPGVTAYLGQSPNGLETQAIQDNFGLKSAGDFIEMNFCLVNAGTGGPNTGDENLNIRLRYMRNNLLSISMHSGE